MDNHDPLDQQRLPADHAFAELGKMVLGNQSVDETLRYVADLVRQTLPMIDEVSVTLMNDETAETVVFTGPLAVHLDERQYESGFGPCLDAALSGETIIVDMSADNSHTPTSPAYVGGPVSRTPPRWDCRYRSRLSVPSICTPRPQIRRTGSQWHGCKASRSTSESP